MELKRNYAKLSLMFTYRFMKTSYVLCNVEVANGHKNMIPAYTYNKTENLQHTAFFRTSNIKFHQSIQKFSGGNTAANDRRQKHKHHVSYMLLASTGRAKGL